MKKPSIDFQQLMKKAALAKTNLNNILPDLSKLAPDFKTTISDSLLKNTGTQRASVNALSEMFKPLTGLSNVNALSEIFKPLTGLSNVNVHSEMGKSLTGLSSVKIGALVKLDPMFAVGTDYKRIAQVMSADFKKVKARFTKIGQEFAELALSTKEYLAFLDEEDFDNFPYNWLTFITPRVAKKLYEAWKNGEHVNITGQLRDEFSKEETIGRVLETLSNSELFAPRMLIIKDALDAHLAEHYTLAIPVILAQIDGIFIERYAFLEDKLTRAETCPKCKHKDSKPMLLNARNVSEYLARKESKFLGYFLGHVLDVFARLRNDILHGKKLDYPDADLSTKLVLTLYQLYYSTMDKLIIEELEELEKEF